LVKKCGSKVPVAFGPDGKMRHNTGCFPGGLLNAPIGIALLLLTFIKVPGTLVPQSGQSTVSSKDRKSDWKAKWNMEQIQLLGKRAVRFTETGSGRLSAFRQEVRWNVSATWQADDKFIPVETEKTITAADGSILLVEKKQFDHEKRVVRFERREKGIRPETKSVEFPEDTLAAEGLAGVLRFVTIDQSHDFAAHVLSNEPSVYSVTFEWRGEERIKTPAGEFDCYKVEMVPHLGILNLIRPFLSKTYFWFTKAEPHYWVRYEGSESGPGTPDVVMQLSSGTH
jgi:hypothetical protein